MPSPGIGWCWSRHEIISRVTRLFVASKIAALTGDKSQYIRNRAFDDAHYKQMILQFLAEFGTATRKDMDDLLRGKLSDGFTPDQQGIRIKNLLGIMARRDRTIINSGSRKVPCWVLRNMDTKPDVYPEMP